MYTSTYTKSQSDTFTEARARYVLGKIFDDFNGIIFRGFTTISSERIKGWRDDVAFVMENNALYHFEIQFKYGYEEWALRYEVDKYGGVSRDDKSGGSDFYNIPDRANLSIVVQRDSSNETVSQYLKRTGWDSGGTFIAADGTGDRVYSKDGFGVNRKKKGDF